MKVQDQAQIKTKDIIFEQVRPKKSNNRSLAQRIKMKLG